MYVIDDIYENLLNRVLKSFFLNPSDIVRFSYSFGNGHLIHICIKVPHFYLERKVTKDDIRLTVYNPSSSRINFTVKNENYNVSVCTINFSSNIMRFNNYQYNKTVEMICFIINAWTQIEMTNHNLNKIKNNDLFI